MSKARCSFSNRLRNQKTSYPWSLAILAIMTLASACSQSGGGLQELKKSRVTPSAQADQFFKTEDGDLRVLSRAKFEELVATGQVKKLNLKSNLTAQEQAANNDPAALLVALPKAMLGQEHYFGAVIVATDDTESEELGGLKLTDMTPTHVYPRLSTDANQVSTLHIEGCLKNCKPNSTVRNKIVDLPVSGFDDEKFYVDFATVGDDLNLVEILDPTGSALNLHGVSSRTVQVSYGKGTLLFDVEGTMESEESLDSPDLKQVKFTTKWYLQKRNLNPNFKPQVATPGVGYFMTERGETEHAIKHPFIDSRGFPQHVHYFIKNVPAEHRDSFKQAFEDWNDVFQSKIGIRLLTYDFVDANDPLAAEVVAGDVRVHVLEWDLVNQAGYGGLGPSIADQDTGSILTSNVLVQGPTIIKIYTTWFQVNREAQALRDAGLDSDADALLKSVRSELVDEMNDLRKPKAKYALTLGKDIAFNVRSQDPRLMDAAAAKVDFEILPANVTYEEYMYGYFRELVGHELGHNMGLRHNFRGNLFASNDLAEGQQSASIMEYLGRAYRFKDRINSYDKMAIAYGYANVTPERRDMFCTDENVGNVDSHSGSAECSRDDAENNPYAMLTARFQRSLDYYIAKGSAEAPVWTLDDIRPQFKKYIDGLLLYGDSAERSMNTWLRFFAAPGRPRKDADAIKAYVVKTIGSIVCDPSLEATISTEKGSGTPAAQQALEHLTEFRNMTKERVEMVLPGLSESALSCVSETTEADFID